MLLAKEQAEVAANALIAPAQEKRARLNAHRDIRKRRANSPRLHLYSAICFFLAAVCFAYRSVNQSTVDWFTASLFLIASIAQFVAFLAKRNA